MGQAKRRKAEIEVLKQKVVMWRASLTEEERVIVDLSMKLDEKLVRGMKFYEGCYHLTFFMAKYLDNKGIDVDPVIGWVNDGHWDGVASHAWVEFLNKKTDVSLGYTLHPKQQPTGSTIIQDHVVHKGMANYLYYKNDNPIVIQSLEKLRTISEFSLVLAEKELQHKYMLSIAQSRDFDAYLCQAPSGLRYDDICKLIYQ